MCVSAFSLMDILPREPLPAPMASPFQNVSTLFSSCPLEWLIFSLHSELSLGDLPSPLAQCASPLLILLNIFLHNGLTLFPMSLPLCLRNKP